MWTVYSDGGSDSRGHAAGACIIKNSNSTIAYASYLGNVTNNSATNNEAEIFSAIMGFSFVLLEAENENIKSLKWVSDSEYSIKSATQYIHAWRKNGWKTAQKKPVKNQGLWKTFDALVSGIKINAEHVYGHSGHPENESCDAAVAYLRETRGDFQNGLTQIESPVINSWTVFDGSELLQKIRENEESGLVFSEILSFFKRYKLEQDLVLPNNQVKAKTKSNNNLEKSELKRNELSNFKNITGEYLKKISSLNNFEVITNENPEILLAIQVLKKYL